MNILAIVSSMTLNNLNSGVVVDHYKDSTYLNTGAWGARISQTNAIASLLIDELKPRTVILVSNMDDWIKGEDYVVDTALFRRYLTRWSPIEGYLQTMKPSFLTTTLNVTSATLLATVNWLTSNSAET